MILKLMCEKIIDTKDFFDELFLELELETLCSAEGISEKSSVL